MGHERLLDVTRPEDLKLFAEWTQEDILELAKRIRELRAQHLVMVIFNVFLIGLVIWRGK